MADLTKKEQELLEQLAKNGQVMVSSQKELENLSKKLEKIYGKSDLKV